MKSSRNCWLVLLPLRTMYYNNKPKNCFSYIPKFSDAHEANFELSDNSLVQETYNCHSDSFVSGKVNMVTYNAFTVF